jgi:hypothetical protein
LNGFISESRRTRIKTAIELFGLLPHTSILAKHVTDLAEATSHSIKNYENIVGGRSLLEKTDDYSGQCHTANIRREEENHQQHTSQEWGPSS